jgi:hypothetical protein
MFYNLLVDFILFHVVRAGTFATKYFDSVWCMLQQFFTYQSIIHDYISLLQSFDSFQEKSIPDHPDQHQRV